MSVLYAIGGFILDRFVDLWNMLLHDAEWIGIVVLGFVVLRLLLMVFRSFLPGARSDE